MPQCPLVIALVPLKSLTVEIYNFLIGCPFPKEIMPWCPCPFQTRLYSSHLMGKEHITSRLDIRQVRLVTIRLDLPTSPPLLNPFEEEDKPVDRALDWFL